eukprot:TRINITY_DN33683_c0_g1_i1.p1 TRINITY_DN33683_c0_g1~~TRINITY_DN33683_c0_g1_i1.p1  ORF type:complete len:989 (+),score=202.71 TRINITY_DN33683_c0_g1_i1:151-3117(+)
MASEPQNIEALTVQLNALRALQSGGTPHLEAAIQEVETRIAEQVALQEAPKEEAAEEEEEEETPPPTTEEKPPPAPMSEEAIMKKMQSTPLVVATSRACEHNTWDNVRTKKGQVFLRCRLCDSQWRTPVESLDRCPLFNTPGGCLKAADCPQLHLHSRKQSLQERIALHGSTVLERVPPGSHAEEDEKDAKNDDTQEENAVATTKPCTHNTWDNVRTKKGQVFLRCRECESQWRTPVEELDRCAGFNTTTGCQVQNCKQLHLHTRKQSLAERLAKHGAGILEKVPGPEQAGGALVFTLQKVQGGSIGMNVKGNTVTKVEQGSPASYAGLREGMVVMGINHRQVGNSTKEVVAVMRDAWLSSNEIKVIIKAPQHPYMQGDGNVSNNSSFHSHGQHHPNHMEYDLSDILTISTNPSSAMPTTPQHPTPAWYQQSWQPQPPNPPSNIYSNTQDTQSQCSGSSYGAGAVDITFAVQKKYQTEPLGLSVKRDMVTKVAAGSPAALAGIVEGMKIMMVNSAPVGGTTNEVVAMVRHAWQCGNLIHVTARTPGSTAPPPLEPSISDVMSESQGSQTPRTTTHSPYAVEAPNQQHNTDHSPPLLHNMPGVRPQPQTTSIEIETLVVIRKHEATTFGAAVKGNRVSKVAPGSAAAAAGIYEGMYVLSVNGEPVEKTTIAVVTAVRSAWKQDEPSMEVVVRATITKTIRQPEAPTDACSVSTGAMSVSEGSSNWQEVYSLPDDSCNVKLPCVATVTVGGTALIWPAVEIKDCDAESPGWHDRPYELFNFPSFLKNSVLYQPPHKDVPAGSLHSVYLHQECDVYLAHSNALGRDGGFPGVIEKHGWTKEDEAPEWKGSPVAALGMSMWHIKVRKGETVALPTTKTAQSTFCLFLVRTGPLDEDAGSLPNMSFSTFDGDDAASNATGGRMSRQHNSSTPTPSLPDDCSNNGDHTPRSVKSVYSAGGSRSLTVPPVRKTRKRSSTGTKLKLTSDIQKVVKD